MEPFEFRGDNWVFHNNKFVVGWQCVACGTWRDDLDFDTSCACVSSFNNLQLQSDIGESQEQTDV